MTEASIPSEGAIGQGLTMLALFGCALHGATPEQVARIKGEALPMLGDLSNPMSWVVERLFDIRGPDWNPVNESGTWGEWLDDLIRAARERGAT